MSHTLKRDAYQVCYGAPPIGEADTSERIAWIKWRDEMNASVVPRAPVPLEWHTDDCTGCG